MTHLYAHDCSLRDYLNTLPDCNLADLWAMRHGWNICPADPYRYQTYIYGAWYRLASLPSRAEMIEEMGG